VHSPKPFSATRAKDYILRCMQNILKRSFETQTADHHHLNFRIGIRVPKPRCRIVPPKSFHGTCAECMSKIGKAVERTSDAIDYDGLKPFLRIIDQMEKKEKPIDAWTVDSRNDGQGTICVGMALAIIRQLKKEFGIKGSLIVVRPEGEQFEHAAVFIECSDGIVLTENPNPKGKRLYSFLFNSTTQIEDCCVTVLPKGTLPTLTVTSPDQRVEYYTHVANGADLVSKQYMSSAIKDSVPIVVYKEDGSPLKDMQIKLLQGRVQLLDRVKSKKEFIPFKSICSGEARAKILDFMGSDFHISPLTAYEEIVRFVTHEYLLRKLFSQAQP
jgi:hypothetical protein